MTDNYTSRKPSKVYECKHPDCGAVYSNVLEFVAHQLGHSGVTLRDITSRLKSESQAA